MSKQEIIFIIKVLNDGGAERVVSMLANHFFRSDYRTKILVTHQHRCEVDTRRIQSGIEVIALEDEAPKSKRSSSFHMMETRVIGKALSILTGNQDYVSIKKYAARNKNKISWMKSFLKKHKDAVLMAFLYDAIFLALLSRGRYNRVVISDRGDPGQSIGSKTDIAFFRTMFPKADTMVFQSLDVKKWYKKNVGIDGQVIFNPITEGLPESYVGERKKRIVNFCRINPQKNLILLIEAFEMLHRDYSDYELFIYGDPGPNDGEYAQRVYRYAEKSACSNAIHFLHAEENIHSLILDYAMFVSSSDFEGMSNSMLEAMAIGLPVVCTDCPAGGARAVIRDHENGILVPVNDAIALYTAMKELIKNPDLANRIAQKAVRIREDQSEKKIMKQWEKILM